MGKLGKKARKFAKKNLQSVLKNRRKFKAKRDSFRRKSAHCPADNPEPTVKPTDPLSSKILNAVDCLLDGLSSGDEHSSIEDISDSDGYLSEDPDCPYISGCEHESVPEDMDESSISPKHKNEVVLELAKQKKKLEMLKKKDPDFSAFLERHRHNIIQFGREESYPDEEPNDDKMEATNIDSKDAKIEKNITGHTVDVWCWMITDQKDDAAVRSLINSFRCACYYTTNVPGEIPQHRIQSRDAYSKILAFVLFEADAIFRRLLGVSDSCDKESILQLKSTTKWKATMPLIKSYLKSTLFLLSQFSDSSILTLLLARLRVSVVFFTVFPTLAKRLIKTAAHLWVTGEESLSSSSFFLMRDLALCSRSDFLDSCLKQMYKAFVTSCKFAEPSTLKRIENLGDLLVDIYSVDVSRSYQNVLASLQQLSNIFQYAFRTKKKEELKKISSWQYIKCLHIWIKFIACNINDYDLQPLLYLIIQIITGVAHLFTGPRYLPLRLQCVQMLNQLSFSSGVFIPVTNLILDFFEFRESIKNETKLPNNISLSSVLKAPKQWVKSKCFYDECILCAIELLSAHLYQWSYHISFPELATFPIILIKRSFEKLTMESARRSVKRFIDQVQQNIEYVERERDGVSFSPGDTTSIESFLQFEKIGRDSSFTQYYKNILQKAGSRNMNMC